MNQRLLRAGLVTVALSGGLGCEPTMDEVRKKHAPAVEKVFGQIKALGAKVESAPSITTDGLGVDGKKIRLDGEASNTVFLHADSVAHPETADEKGTSTILAADLSSCGSVLRGDYPGVVGSANSYMQECGRAEYAFVLRTAERQEPEIVDDKKFVPGKFRGDVLLFHLADGAHLGGFSVFAENASDVHVNANEIDTSRLRDHFDANVFVAIKNKLNAVAPGSVR